MEKSAKLLEYLSTKASCNCLDHHNTSAKVKSHTILLFKGRLTITSKTNNTCI